MSEVPAKLTAVVFGEGSDARRVAGRTVRSAREAGCLVADISQRAPTELAELLARAASPVWLLRAGTWLAAARSIAPPPASASGRPLCALGWPVAALLHNDGGRNSSPEPRPSGSGAIPALPDGRGSIEEWHRLYVEFGGDLARAVEAGCPLPPPFSVVLEPPLCQAVASRLCNGTDFEHALNAELQTGRYRLVRYAPLDVHFDHGLRVAQVVTSLQRGGAERVTIDLARALGGSGTHCRVIAIGSPTRAPFPGPPGTCDLSKMPRDRATRVAAAIRVAVADGCDVVHAHLLDRSDLAQLSSTGLPVLATVHNTRSGWQAGQAELQTGEADLLVACAQAVEAELEQTRVPIVLRTVWNGIDAGAISRQGCDGELRRRVRRERGIGADDVVLLTLANPRPQKRFPLLPAIVAALREKVRQYSSGVFVRLLLAGEAALVHPAARQTVEDTNAAIALYQVQDAVTWLGAVDDVAGILAAADVLISASAHEGLSLAYVEALSVGLPVVATDVGGTRELAGPDVPLRLLPVDASADQFAAAIVECLNLVPGGIGEPGIASERAAETSARQSTEPQAGAVRSAVRKAVALPDFTLDRMCERYAWLYPRVIAANRRRLTTAQPSQGLWLITNNFSTGGAQSSARRLLMALARDGVSVRAAVLQEAVTNPTPSLQALRAAGVRVEVMPLAGTMDTAVIVARLLDLIEADPPRSVLLWNVIPEYKILLADGLLGIPVFDISPGEMYFASLERYFARPRPGLPYRTAADYGRRLQGVIVKYHAEAQSAASLLRAPVHVIPNGVPMNGPPQRRSLNGQLVIGTAARISPQKRLEDLLAAVSLAHSRLPPYTLQIAGATETGAETYAEELRLAAHGLPVEWLGEVTNVGGFLHGLDLFAQVSEPAGCPNASLEALAAGLPIVATDVGGAAEQIVDGVTGRLVPRRDPTALAEALVQLAHDSSLRERYSHSGHEHAQRHFSLDRMVADYRRVCLDSL